jgi:hypothetical protein
MRRLSIFLGLSIASFAAGALPAAAQITCVTDNDCPADTVCETTVVGDCTSAARACVPGCRFGQRPCQPGLQCVDNVCKTCPCPDSCVALTPSFCSEWGFEAGSFGLWTCLQGKFRAANTTQSCLTSTMHQLVNPGNDPWNIPKVGKPGGAWAVRIGDLRIGGNAAAIQKTFVVTPATAVLRFNYALALQTPSPPHTPSSQPYFVASASVGSKSVYTFTKVSDPSDGFFSPSSDGVTLIRRWSCGLIDLTPYIGQVATVRFEASDCSPGGHFGYAYLDFPCQPLAVQLTVPEKVCAGAAVLANGAANDGVVNHFWSVERSDANYGRNPQEEVGDWFAGPPPAQFDVAAFAASKGRPMTCGNYYRVKLALQTECDPWIETVKLVYVQCGPQAFAGPDICCEGGVLGSTPVPNMQYSWSPAKGLSSATAPDPSFLAYPGAQYPLTYTLTAKDGLGCTTVSSARVFCGKPAVSVTCDGDVCSPLLTAHAPNASSFTWSNGGVGPQLPILSNGTYTVTASNSCRETATAGTMVGSASYGSFPPLIFPNAFSPNGVNKVFQIFQFGIDKGARPAYNATGYSLSIFDRFGGQHVVAHEEVPACGSFYNGQIQWDGKINGSVVQTDTYTWQLRGCLKSSDMAC